MTDDKTPESKLESKKLESKKRVIGSLITSQLRTKIPPTRHTAKSLTKKLNSPVTVSGHAPMSKKLATEISKVEEPRLNSVLEAYKKKVASKVKPFTLNSTLKDSKPKARVPIQKAQANKIANANEALLNKFRTNPKVIATEKEIEETRKNSAAAKAIEDTVKAIALRNKATALKDANVKISTPPLSVNDSLKLPAIASTMPELKEESDRIVRVEKHELTYDIANEEQRQAVNFGVEGKSFVLIGSAGTGKTATQRLSVEALLKSNKYPRLCKDITSNDEGHKYINEGMESIFVLTFMNKAANNIRKALPDEMAANVLTIHKFLQYGPEVVERDKIDPDTGETYPEEVKIFTPKFGKNNKIHGISCIIIEEASTVDNKILFQQLLDALDDVENIQFIFLGDLKQLPPPFGEGVLSVKLLELPVIELTKTYRQHLESKIKQFAVAINEGKPLSDESLKLFFEKEGELEFFKLSGKRPAGQVGKDGKKYIKRTVNEFEHSRKAVQLAGKFCELLDSGEFVPFRDIILIPHKVNKRDDINVDYLNTLLAEDQGKKRNAEVFEIVAGRFKKYFAINDPVTYNKEDYLIVNIQEVDGYSGSPAKAPHTSLDRWGNYEDSDFDELNQNMFETKTDEYISKLLASSTSRNDSAKDSSSKDDEEDITRKSSHSITLVAAELLTDSNYDANNLPLIDSLKSQYIELSTSGDINKLEFAYATTVHKSIGSEWEKVWFILTHYMATMAFRELLYTAVSRAKNYLGVFYDGTDCVTNSRNSSMIEKAIINPRIKGVTLEEKLKWLQAQAENAKLSADGGASLLAKFKK